MILSCVSENVVTCESANISAGVSALAPEEWQNCTEVVADLIYGC